MTIKTTYTMLIQCAPIMIYKIYTHIKVKILHNFQKTFVKSAVKKNVYLQDFLFCLALFRSRGARVLCVVAVRTQASSSSSSPVSYISESVVTHPRDDEMLFRLVSENLRNNFSISSRINSLVISSTGISECHLHGQNYVAMYTRDYGHKMLKIGLLINLNCLTKGRYMSNTYHYLTVVYLV